MTPSTRAGLRWLMLVVLLGLAVLVALNPRKQSEQAEPDPAGAPPPQRSADLGELRAAAALQPCPAPTPGGPTPPRGPLTGVEVPCLGEPGTVDVGAALAGGPALLNLWGPLCRPCVEELPALAAYAEEPDAIPVLGVEVQGLPEGALDMLVDLDVHLPSVHDPDGRLRAALGAPQVLPLSFVHFPDGRVEQITPPTVLRSPEQVRETVQRHLDPGATG